MTNPLHQLRNEVTGELGILEKMTIRPEKGMPIKVLFNPNTISISKTAAWHLQPQPETDTSASHFTHGQPATLTVELLFDTFEKDRDVRDYTRPIFHLTLIQKLGGKDRPPLCRLQWGSFDFEGYRWFLAQLDQRFTLFRSSGMPVRAVLNCSFTQWQDDSLKGKARSGLARVKTQTTASGNSLSGIAGDAYGRPDLWRKPAKANGIVNPRRMLAGTQLFIP